MVTCCSTPLRRRFRLRSALEYRMALLARAVGAVATLMCGGCSLIGLGIGWSTESPRRKLDAAHVESRRGMQVNLEVEGEGTKYAAGEQHRTLAGKLTVVDWCESPDSAFGRAARGQGAGPRAQKACAWFGPETGWARVPDPVKPARVCVEQPSAVSSPSPPRPAVSCVEGFDAIYRPAGGTGKWIGLGIGAAIDVIVITAVGGNCCGPR